MQEVKSSPNNEFESVEAMASNRNFRTLLFLRTIAINLYAISILVTYFILDLMVPIRLIFAELSILALINFYAFIRLLKIKKFSDFEIFLWLLLDSGFLFLILLQTGGPSNPFISLLIVTMMLGSLMLPSKYAWGLFAITMIAFLGLEVSDSPFVVGHKRHTSFFDIHTQSMMIAYAITASLLVYFVNQISRTLRERDINLRKIQRKTMEEQEIMRIGLLSAGAAHELGTPLSTIAVILSDWRDIGLPKNREVRNTEIDRMLSQIERCKKILSDILLSSGQLRGEDTIAQDISIFVGQLTNNWRNSQGKDVILNTDIQLPAITCACDRVIEQAIFNVLDNAKDASFANDSKEINFKAFIQDDEIIIMIEDFGNGFDVETLHRLGQPYISTKEQTGHGLGLFLVTNILRTLGGSFEAHNKNDGNGAIISLCLPINSIAVRH